MLSGPLIPQRKSAEPGTGSVSAKNVSTGIPRTPVHILPPLEEEIDSKKNLSMQIPDDWSLTRNISTTP